MRPVPGIRPSNVIVPQISGADSALLSRSDRNNDRLQRAADPTGSDLRVPLARHDDHHARESARDDVLCPSLPGRPALLAFVTQKAAGDTFINVGDDDQHHGTSVALANDDGSFGRLRAGR